MTLSDGFMKELDRLLFYHLKGMSQADSEATARAIEDARKRSIGESSRTIRGRLTAD
jgi:hypothetical protein